jgi:hypothetical protein
MTVPLDLFIERTPGEDGGGEWLRIGEELHREFNRRAADLFEMVQGRVVHEIMERWWPDIAANPAMPDHLREYFRIWVDTPKVLVSRTRTEAGYNTRASPDPTRSISSPTCGTTRAATSASAVPHWRHSCTRKLARRAAPLHPPRGARKRTSIFDLLDRPVELELPEQPESERGVTTHGYGIATA